MRRVSFKTVGCRLNQAETAQIAARFSEKGYSVVPFSESADACIIHTCTITRTAERKCVRFARMARKQSPESVIALIGCAVEVNRDALLEQTGADIAIGQDGKLDVAERVEEIQNKSNPDSQAPSASLDMLSYPPLLPVFERTRAIVKIQDGCNFRCTYCIVPDARGKPRSRPFAEIVDEVAGLAGSGFREIVLTGANLGCYRDGAKSLVDLIMAIENVDNLQRIRLSSIESSTTETAVLDYMATSTKLCHYIHLPLQSGDDGVLKAMGRRYSVAEFRKLVEHAAERVPGIGIGSDVLVGFPGETEEAFQNTFNLLESLPFSNLHVFPYSIRPGTPAATFPNQLPRVEKRRRADELIALGERKRTGFAKTFIGKPVDVLIEEVSADGSSGTGWTSQYIEARIAAPDLKENELKTFIPTALEDDFLV